MVATDSGKMEHRTESKRKLLSAAIVGLGFLIISTTLFFVDPILYAVQYKLRVENGSLVHELLMRRFESTKVYLYLYNVSNAERFLAGDDEKVKIEEIGPFVYQEYRTNEDLEINKDPGIMRYTPRFETKFLPEESIGDPKHINVTVPNIVLLSAAALVSKYSFLVRQLFNVVAVTSRSKAFVNLKAHDYIWGYKDDLIRMANSAVPGLLYYKSVGLLERLYDVEIDYRLEVETQNAEKFNVNKATKIQAKHKNNVTVLIDNTFTYNNTYEGAAFPPNLTPEIPINIYRPGLCKTFQLQHVASKRMHYGGDGFIYHMHNDTYRDRQLCDTRGWCPEGLKNLADCYFGFPIAVSKGHFLDADPRLLDMVEGLKPDRELHDTTIVIDPNIGVAISGTFDMQLSLVLADLGFNPQTRRFKNTVLPISNMIAKSPPMIEEVKTALRLLYHQGPYIILSSQVVCALIGGLLLLYAAIKIYRNWSKRTNVEPLEKVR